MKKLLYLTGAALLVGGSLQAAVYTWTGAAADDGDWFNGANWDVPALNFNDSADIRISGVQSLDQYIRVHTAIRSLKFIGSNDGDTAIGLRATNGANRDLTFTSSTGTSTLSVVSGSTGDKTIGADLSGSLTSGELVINSSLDIINDGSGDLVIAAEMRGSGDIVVSGSGTTVFSSDLNTHEGDVNVANGSSLILNNGAVWNLDVQGNGVSSEINGNGTLTLNGALSFDLAGASITLGDSWQIVDVDNLNVTYGANFDCVSGNGYFTRVDGRWSTAENGIGYEFSEETGMLTVVPVGNWLSGAVGVGWWFPCISKSRMESWNVEDSDPTTADLMSQIDTIPGITHVIVNLSSTFDTYTAPHPVLQITAPDTVPDRDLFMDVVDAFQARGIRVIAYIATQGPAMLKHGAIYAKDGNDSSGIWTSQTMLNWEAHVKGAYPNWQTQFADEREMYKVAFAEIIVDEFAQRYGSKIDGWWFDSGPDAMNAPLLHTIATNANPNIACAFGGSLNNDYTNGHPHPLINGGTPITDFSNQEKLLHPIEVTEDGYILEGDGSLSLGHMFMSAHDDTWTSGNVAWTPEQAADWIERCTTAGGAWTWSVGEKGPVSGASDLQDDPVALIIAAQAARQVIENNTPPVFNEETIIGGEVTIDNAYSGSVSGLATDAEGDSLMYQRLNGPSWLQVAADGTLSGTPTDPFVVGMTRFKIGASDGKGNIGIAELEIIVRNPETNDRSYLALEFSSLNANLSLGMIIDGVRPEGSDISLTKTLIGNDALYDVSIQNQNLDRDGDSQDSLSWRIRAKAYGPGSYTLNGNSSAVTLGSNLAVGTSDNEFGTDDRYLFSGESVQFSVENITVNATTVSTGEFHGFSNAWFTTGSYIFGTGTGLESITTTANGSQDLPISPVLVMTATGDYERLKLLEGVFRVYRNSQPYFALSNITLNASQGNISSSLSALNGAAVDPDNEPLTYSKVSGASWLSVSSNGTLSGDSSGVIPGDYTFVVEVTDGNGAVDQIILTTTVELNTNPAIRVTEYYLTTGDFTGLETTVTLDQSLADDYFILVRGSRTGDAVSFPDNNYARVTAVPFGKHDMLGSGGTKNIKITRHVADVNWEGVMTVVECLNSDVPSGFKLLDIVATPLTSTSGTDAANAWSDVNQVVLFGGYRGGGVSFNVDAGSRNLGTSVFTRIYPSGTNTINWIREAGGETLLDATMTTFVIEWGSDWNVQRAFVSGSNSGNGANITGEYTTAGISSVNRSNSWVWGTGTRADAGIGDCAEACLVTLGDGVNQNTNETVVAVGSEYTDQYKFDVYVMTHDNLAVDYRFIADGNANALDLPVTVDSATSGKRFSWVYNGSAGIGNGHPRSLLWSRYTADDEVTISRGCDSTSFPAWVQGIDFSALND